MEGLMTIRELAAHCHRSYSTVAKWSSGHLTSPYPEPVRGVNGCFMGWRREDIERTDEANRYSRADYLQGKVKRR